MPVPRCTRKQLVGKVENYESRQRERELSVLLRELHASWRQQRANREDSLALPA